MSYKLFPHSFMCKDRKGFLSFCGLSFPLIIISLLFLFAQGGYCSQESWTKDTLLYEEYFDSGSLDNWKSELQKPDVSVVDIQDGKLNIDVGGGATIWFKHKLDGDVLIEYDGDCARTRTPRFLVRRYGLEIHRRQISHRLS